MERLSALDAAFIYGETPAWHMHAGAIMVFDPSTASPPLTVERVRELLWARVGQLGLFRKRLVEVPFGLDRPYWVLDPDLDVDAHVRAVGVPSPGGPRELARLAGDLFESKLDRSRPLWEIWFIEGLADGRVALLPKVHHALTDGMRGAALYEVLFDTDPDAPLERPGPTPEPPERVPSEWELTARALVSLAATPVRAARTIAHLLGSGLGLARFTRTPAWERATLPFQAPRTSLNQPITPRRAVAFCTVPLSGVKRIKDAFGVTVNDVILAMCAGSLRRYLSERGELPEQPLVAEVPVGLRVQTPRGEQPAGGNFVSVIGARLCTNVGDPVERLQLIHESAESAKEMLHVVGDAIVMDAARALPPPVVAAGVRAYVTLRLAEHHPPIFNLIVSNVRGPSFPLYAAGARLVASYPIGPLLDGGGLNVTVMSYCDSVDLGVAVCPDVVEDPWVIADGIRDSFEGLLAAVPAAESA